MQRLDIADFKFDPRSNAYRWTSGAGKGQFASKQAVLARTERFIVERSQNLVDLATAVNDRAIGLKDFQREAGAILKDIHIAQAILGRGGVEKMKSEDWLSVGRILRQQYYSGIGEDGDRIALRRSRSGQADRFGLRYLAQDIAAGEVSLAQLQQRLKLYAMSGKRSFWEMARVTQKESGKVYARRVLGDAQHCAECVKYAAMPPQSIDRVILPTQACSCRSNCRCSLVFLTLEEAIARQ